MFLQQPNTEVSINTVFFMYNMQIWLLQKVFPFSSKLAKGSEQLSWLVKKEHLFPKNKVFKHVHFFDICTKYTSLNANKHFFTNVSWGALLC